MTKVGIDIGGTFTDLILIDEKRTATYKLPSTPDNPGRAALEGLAVLLAREGIAPSAVAMLAHGTTVATNTVIQRKGAKTALITTRGFRDVLEIARLGRPPEAIYDIQYETAPPLVPRHLRFEVSERVNYRGEVASPL
ncbi:MAG: hydantoinase/oxoprolinase family protein, partial [Nitrospinae bacterium]|nr:hydantoinase/oxoprolinase family protein [Nitrospinota bacterium]